MVLGFGDDHFLTYRHGLGLGGISAVHFCWAWFWVAWVVDPSNQARKKASQRTIKHVCVHAIAGIMMSAIGEPIKGACGICDDRPSYFQMWPRSWGISDVHSCWAWVSVAWVVDPSNQARKRASKQTIKHAHVQAVTGIMMSGSGMPSNGVCGMCDDHLSYLLRWLKSWGGFQPCNCVGRGDRWLGSLIRAIKHARKQAIERSSAHACKQ